MSRSNVVIFDHFGIIAPDFSDFSDESCKDISFLKPRISYQYPTPTKKKSLSQHICMFIFPEQILLKPKDDLPRFHTFVLTNETGKRQYAGCLVFSDLLFSNSSSKQLFFQKSVVLVSSWPFYSLMREVLNEMYFVAKSTTPTLIPIERYVSFLFNSLPLPPAGKLLVTAEYGSKKLYMSRPPPNKLPLLDLPLKRLFQCITIPNIITIWTYLLLEQKILFVAESLANTSLFSTAFLGLLFPFVYCHVYVPILSGDLVHLVHAPVPFVCGCTEFEYQKMPQVPDDVLVVFCEKNQIILPKQVDYEPLPPKVYNSLKKQLEKQASSIFDPKSPDIHSFSNAFLGSREQYTSFEQAQLQSYEEQDDYINKKSLENVLNSRKRYLLSHPSEQLLLVAFMTSSLFHSKSPHVSFIASDSVYDKLDQNVVETNIATIDDLGESTIDELDVDSNSDNESVVNNSSISVNSEIIEEDKNPTNRSIPSITSDSDLDFLSSLDEEASPSTIVSPLLLPPTDSFSASPQEIQKKKGSLISKFSIPKRALTPSSFISPRKARSGSFLRKPSSRIRRGPDFNDEFIRLAFFHAISLLLKHYDAFISPPSGTKISFATKEFISNAHKTYYSFLSLFLSTQCFEQYIEQRASLSVNPNLQKNLQFQFIDDYMSSHNLLKTPSSMELLNSTEYRITRSFTARSIDIESLPQNEYFCFGTFPFSLREELFETRDAVEPLVIEDGSSITQNVKISNLDVLSRILSTSTESLDDTKKSSASSISKRKWKKFKNLFTSSSKIGKELSDPSSEDENAESPETNRYRMSSSSNTTTFGLSTAVETSSLISNPVEVTTSTSTLPSNVVAAVSPSNKIQHQDAGTLIVSFCKFYLIRKHYLEKKIASIILQKYIRGYFVRTTIAKQKKAVTIIQKYCRGYLARKSIQNLKNKIILVQSIVRGYQVRKRIKKMRCAIIKIQAVVRGRAQRIQNRTLLIGSLIDYQRQLWEIWHDFCIPFAYRAHFIFYNSFWPLELIDSERAGKDSFPIYEPFGLNPVALNIKRKKRGKLSQLVRSGLNNIFEHDYSQTDVNLQSNSQTSESTTAYNKFHSQDSSSIQSGESGISSKRKPKVPNMHNASISDITKFHQNSTRIMHRYDADSDDEEDSDADIEHFIHGPSLHPANKNPKILSSSSKSNDFTIFRAKVFTPRPNISIPISYNKEHLSLKTPSFKILSHYHREIKRCLSLSSGSDSLSRLTRQLAEEKRALIPHLRFYPQTDTSHISLLNKIRRRFSSIEKHYNHGGPSEKIYKLHSVTNSRFKKLALINQLFQPQSGDPLENRRYDKSTPPKDIIVIYEDALFFYRIANLIPILE